jgi:hypothetical protein
MVRPPVQAGALRFVARYCRPGTWVPLFGSSEVSTPWFATRGLAHPHDANSDLAKPISAMRRRLRCEAGSLRRHRLSCSQDRDTCSVVDPDP